VYDTTGMEVTAYYNDGTSEVVEGYTVAPDEIDSYTDMEDHNEWVTASNNELSRHATQITVEYTELYGDKSITVKTTQDITVTPAITEVTEDKGIASDTISFTVNGPYSDSVELKVWNDSNRALAILYPLCEGYSIEYGDFKENGSEIRIEKDLCKEYFSISIDGKERFSTDPDWES